MNDTNETAKPQDPQKDADALVIEALFRQTAQAIRDSHAAIEKLGAVVGERDEVLAKYQALAGEFKNCAFSFAQADGDVAICIGDDTTFSSFSFSPAAAHTLASNILDAIAQIEEQ